MKAAETTTAASVPHHVGGAFVPEATRTLLEQQLLPDERILFLAQPRALRRAITRGAGPFLFGVAFTTLGLSLATEVAHLAVFMVLGVAALLNPLLTYRDARLTIFVVTDRRALILSRGPGDGPPTLADPLTASSFGPAQIDRMMVERRGDGSGSVIFEEHRSGKYRVRVGFLDIDDVDTAERELRALSTRDRQ